MTKRLYLTLALVTAIAFALTVAAPVHACQDCDCPRKAGAKKTDSKSDSKPEAKPDSKPVEKPTGKPTSGEKKAALTTPPSMRVAAGDEDKCECEKGGKGCTCKKGQCKCANCGQAPDRS